MAKKLNTYVHAVEVAVDDKGNRSVARSATFGPDDDMSKSENAWAVKAITNPDVWEGGPSEQASAPAEPVVAQDGPPPKGGAGSGAPAWREYAAKNNVEVAEDASREDVVEALTAAGVRTE
ncbi:hypothetical protein ABZ388_06790 [Micromonospora parva]|uniref:hypothetical protein n=1 Tax=Micromonospora parva TaxID=1464048 RepID=UPI0034083E4D